MNQKMKMNNTDYYLLCVMEMSPRFKAGEPFTNKELSYYSDLDKSVINKSLKKLSNFGVVKTILLNPIKYSFDVEVLEQWKK